MFYLKTSYITFSHPIFVYLTPGFQKTFLTSLVLLTMAAAVLLFG